MPDSPTLSARNAKYAGLLQRNVASLMEGHPQIVQIFLQRRMACVGCSMAKFETLQDAARIYGVDPHNLAADIRATFDRTGRNLIHQGDMMATSSTYFEDLLKTVEVIPTESIVSRTILQDGELKVIVFGFDKGQTLSEHTASVPAIIHILEGECDITLGDEKHSSAAAGAWMHMPPKMPHSILAKTPLRMLLIMLPPQG